MSEIETERLLLRPFRESDAADVLKYMSGLLPHCFAGLQEMLRKAELIALQSFPDDMFFCVRCWKDCFHNHDNTMRCMLEAECRSSNSSGFLATAIAHMQFFDIHELAKRCYRKSIEETTDSDNWERIQDFQSEFIWKERKIME